MSALAENGPSALQAAEENGRPPAAAQGDGGGASEAAAEAEADQATSAKAKQDAPAPATGPATMEEAQALLKKLARVPKPDQEKHRAKVEALNVEIKSLLDQIEDIKKQIDSMSEKRQGGKGELEQARSALSQLQLERDALRGELDGIHSMRESGRAKMDAHNKKRRAMQSSVKYNSVEEIDRAIRDLERQQQTTSMSLPEEKKLLKEIGALKESKKILASLSGADDSIKETKDQVTEIRKTEADKKAELRAVQEKIKAQKALLDGMKEKRDTESNPMKDLFNKRTALREQVGAKKAEQRELHAQNKAANETYYQNMLEQRRLRDAVRSFEKEAQAAELEEQRRAMEAEEAKKIPFEEEMALCDQLISYLQVNFMPKAVEDAPAAAAVASPAPTEPEEFDGKVLVVKKRDDEEFMPSTRGKGKKKQGRGGVKTGGSAQGGNGKSGGRKGDAIVHALDTIESFSMLSLEPPNTKSAAAEAIDALRSKKEWYSQQPRGSVPGASSPKKDQARPEKKNNSKAPEITDEAFPSLPGMPAASVVGTGAADGDE